MKKLLSQKPYIMLICTGFVFLLVLQCHTSNRLHAIEYDLTSLTQDYIDYQSFMLLRRDHFTIPPTSNVKIELVTQSGSSTSRTIVAQATCDTDRLIHQIVIWKTEYCFAGRTNKATRILARAETHRIPSQKTSWRSHLFNTDLLKVTIERGPYYFAQFEGIPAQIMLRCSNIQTGTGIVGRTTFIPYPSKTPIEYYFVVTTD